MEKKQEWKHNKRATYKDTDVILPIDYPETGLLQKTIVQMGLLERSIKCLRRAEIMTVNDLISCSEDRILKIRNMGWKNRVDVSIKLQRLGIENSIWEQLCKQHHQNYEIISAPIDQLGLSDHAVRILIEEKIETLFDLLNCEDRITRALHCWCPKDVAVIAKKLTDIGYINNAWEKRSKKTPAEELTEIEKKLEEILNNLDLN